MKPVRHKRLQAQEQRRDQKRTHYLWREMGESLVHPSVQFQRFPVISLFRLLFRQVSPLSL
jgi:hypothetical protein